MLINFICFCHFAKSSNQTKRALENEADVSKCQLVNSNMRSFREFFFNVVYWSFVTRRPYDSHPRYLSSVFIILSPLRLDFYKSSPGGGLVIDETSGSVITISADVQLRGSAQWGVAGGPTDKAITHRERSVCNRDQSKNRSLYLSLDIKRAQRTKHNLEYHQWTTHSHLVYCHCHLSTVARSSSSKRV